MDDLVTEPLETRQTRREELPFPLPGFPFDLYNARGTRRTAEYLHQHDFLEINWVTGGSGTNYINHNAFPMAQNDLFLISNRDHHMAISDGTLEMKILTFSPAILGETSSFRFDYLTPFYRQEPAGEQRRLTGESLALSSSLIKRLEQEWHNREAGFQLMIRALLMELLALIVRESRKTGADTSRTSRDRDYEKIRPALELMKQNFTRPLNLDQLAEEACMSRNYFCDLFKRVMKISSSRYLELIRINQACLLLKSSPESITEICFQCGYSSISGFNHAFKRVCGVSPGEYRKNLQELRNP